MQLHIYVKNDCPLCEPARKLFREIEPLMAQHDVLPVLFNVDEEAGALAGFRYLGFSSTPTVVLIDHHTDEIHQDWAGKVPSPSEILTAIEVAIAIEVAREKQR